jgi:hypothetical protein
MEILDTIVRPFILLLIIGVAYAFVLGQSEATFTKKLVRWIVIFMVFTLLAMMFVPH